MTHFILTPPSPIGDLPRLRRIFNHPKALGDFADRQPLKPTTRSGADASKDCQNLAASLTNPWWEKLCNDNVIEASNKMRIFLAILSECEARNEKLLVFSGCLSTLNVIEHFLEALPQTPQSSASTSKRNWIRGVDYFRLDGAQSAERRKKDIDIFNASSNTRAR